jgi:hypothetical protein
VSLSLETIGFQPDIKYLSLIFNFAMPMRYNGRVKDRHYDHY